MDDDDELTVAAAWKKYTILDWVKNFGLALAQVKATTINACWKNLWPEAVTAGLNTNEGQVNPSSFCTYSRDGQKIIDNEDELNEFFSEPVPSVDELIHFARCSEAHPIDESSEEEGPEKLLTTDNISKGLER